MTSQYGAPSESGASSQYGGASQSGAQQGMPPQFGGASQFGGQQGFPQQFGGPSQFNGLAQQGMPQQFGGPPRPSALFGGPVVYIYSIPGGTQMLQQSLPERFRNMSDEELLANADRIHRKWTRLFTRAWRATQVISEQEFVRLCKISEALFEQLGALQVKVWVAESGNLRAFLRRIGGGGGGAPMGGMGGMGGMAGMGGGMSGMGRGMGGAMGGM